MYKLADFSTYPLSPELTRRVVRYLNGFRIFIALALGVAYFAGALTQGDAIASKTLAAAVLLVYFAFSGYFLWATERKEDQYQLATQSLLMDVFLIALLLNTFDGLAVLLVFVGAAAGIILPLRMALLVASLATLAILSQPVIEEIVGAASAQSFLGAALSALGVFVITVLTHLLAVWVRDYRLIAERQIMTVSQLEQLNELVIRRLRSGVLAVDRDFNIKLMNESAWFLLGSPPAAERALVKVAPELQRALEEWAGDPRLEPETLNLNASQAEIVPKFVRLPAGLEISTLVFLEDNDVVSQRALELSAVSLAKLSTGIAHEVRNPLAAVSNAAQLLAEDEGLDDSQQKLIAMIRRNVRRMDDIVENILQLSRREKSQHELIQVSDWLRELSEEFNAANPRHPFVFEDSQGNDEATVLFDRSQLHQVLWKLMENALQHLGEDNHEPLLVLRLAVEPDSAFCTVSVEDNGKGIADDKITSIFEPFFTTRKEGSGLGLYIARQLCEANQAELTVDSVPGERTRFRLRMGLASGPADVLDLEAYRESR